MMNGVSLFSSAGIGEVYLKEIGVNIVVANEVLEERAKLYKAIFPHSKMIVGDILDGKIYKKILDESGEKVDFLLATPPCQGMSIAGKSRSLPEMFKDKRNYLFFRIVDFIKNKLPDFVLIENVPRLLKLELYHDGKRRNVVDLLKQEFGNKYVIESDILDAADYGVPQRRLRAIIKMYKKGFKWRSLKKEHKVSVREAIGDLPSLESGQVSNIKWHFARTHTEKQIFYMKHTATGKSAFENKKNYPMKDNGERLKGYNTTYRRIDWHLPSPTITIRNDAISSQRNVHCGRLLTDGTYSDARVLTPLELMILSSLPANWNIPDDTPELLLRRCLGECIPPLMTKKIVSQISK
jgi:DNA (cytosine-5)-methyltransferase 1